MDVTLGTYNKFPLAFIMAGYESDEGNRSLLGLLLYYKKNKTVNSYCSVYHSERWSLQSRHRLF